MTAVKHRIDYSVQEMLALLTHQEDDDKIVATPGGSVVCNSPKNRAILCKRLTSAGVRYTTHVVGHTRGGRDLDRWIVHRRWRHYTWDLGRLAYWITTEQLCALDMERVYKDYAWLGSTFDDIREAWFRFDAPHVRILLRSLLPGHEPIVELVISHLPLSRRDIRRVLADVWGGHLEASVKYLPPDSCVLRKTLVEIRVGCEL